MHWMHLAALSVALLSQGLISGDRSDCHKSLVRSSRQLFKFLITKRISNEDLKKKRASEERHGCVDWMHLPVETSFYHSGTT